MYSSNIRRLLPVLETGCMQPHIGIFFAPLTMAYKPQVIPGESDTRSSSLRGRRCYSVTLLSDHNVCTDGHIDQLFCTAKPHHQQLQGKDEDEVSHGSSESSASGRDDDDDEQSHGAECASDQRRHTVEEMFCTQRQHSTTSDDAICLTTTSLPTLQHCCSSSSNAQCCRKQMRSDVMQFVKTTTSEVLKLRRHLKRNKIRTLSDAGEAVYPRQPMIADVDHFKVMANGAAGRDQPPPGDERDESVVTTRRNVFDVEHRPS